MADKDNKNEALEEVKKSADVDKEDVSPAKKPPNKILIGILSLVIFFALFMFFKGQKSSSPPVDEGPDIIMDGAGDSPAIILPGDEAFENAVVERPSEIPADLSEAIPVDAIPTEDPPAGEILIQSEDREIEAMTQGETPAISIPEKELAFFEALKKNRENRPTSAELDQSLSRKKPKSRPSPKIKAQPKPKAKAIIAQRPAAVSDSPFTIQLGAFKKERSAMAFSTRLQKSGYDAYVLPVGRDLFRVRVGHFQSRAEAKRVAGQIKVSEHLDSFVVKR